MKENFLPTVFLFSVSAVVGSISIPRIFQLEYPFPNFSDLVTFSNLMFACKWLYQTRVFNTACF